VFEPGGLDMMVKMRKGRVMLLMMLPGQDEAFNDFG
jgi:hypothetical protein